MKSPRIPEKVIQQQIVTLLRSIGAQVWVLGTRRKRGDYQGTMQTPGLPDCDLHRRCFVRRGARLVCRTSSAGWTRSLRGSWTKAT
jgi:hypothetical protein